ncbi:MAG: hypothetical protein AAB569_04545, partial [Patescibacteria group bacterium]
SWKKYFKKYYNETLVSFFTKKQDANLPYASLLINESQTIKNGTSFFLTQKHNVFTMTVGKTPHFYYPLINNIVQRIFTHLFYTDEGFVLHASAVEYKKKAFVFIGLSGQGKTTIARRAELQYRMPILADNHVFIRMVHNRFFLFPFPFDTIHNRESFHNHLIIRNIYLLSKAKTNKTVFLPVIKKIQLIRNKAQIQIPSFSKSTNTLQKLLFSFVMNVRIEELFFTKEVNLPEIINGTK